MGMKIKRTMGERVGHGIIIFLLTLFAFACIYPFWHVLMYSISDSREAMTGGLFLVPRSPTFLSYSKPGKSTSPTPIPSFAPCLARC